MWESDHKEGWAPKNWCIWRMWCWRRCLRVPWTTWRSKQSILKDINPDYSLEKTYVEVEALLLGHLMQTANSSEKTLEAGKIWGQEEKRMKEDKMVGCHHYSMDMSLSKLREMVKNREAWYAVIHGVTKSQTWLSNWTITTIIHRSNIYQ